MCPTALFSISLSGTEVTGTLADLQNFQQLTELSLSDTAVSGTLSEVRDTALTKLKFLFLSGTQVRADLGDLKHFPQLQGVHLSELTVGDLQTLTPLRQLTHLATPGAPITGELAALAPLRLLELDLARTKVTGYLLQVPQTVQVLDLSFTRVAGNLMDLSLLPLRQLSLKQCDGIGGTLDHLAKSKPSGLEIVLVAQTSIEGDLKDFTGSEHTLKELDLSETKVRGDIQALSKFTQLTSLVLYKLEAVQGDLRSLKALAKLESLDLHESSQLGGEFQSLSPTTLREVDLRHTVVSGSIEPSFARQARLLRNLDVSWTRIRPVFLRHHPFEDELFPKLKVIRMSGLPIQNHAVEVLSVFRHNRFLGIIELSHCSLTGELTGQFLEQEEGAIVRDGERGLSFETSLGGRGPPPDGMTHEDVMKIAEMRRKVLPLGHALVSLDLSHNRISSVVFAVPKPLKYLLLSHNEALTTVSSAFLVAHDIEVDIRHTAVHNRVFSTAPFQAELPLAPHTEGAAFQVENKHYECYQPYRGMAAKRLMVSPDTFDPVGLCKCEGGYEAAASHPGERGELECKVCPANYMSELQDGTTVCVKCPLGSFSSKGSTVCRSLVRNFLKIAFVVGISTLIFFYGLYLLLRQYRRGAQIERDFQIALEIADRLKAQDGSAFSLAKFGEVFVPPRRVPDITRLEPALTHIVLAYNEGRPAPLGKFWKPIPADLVTMVVLVACEIHQEYVDQAMDHWPDQALKEVAESKLGVLYEKQYKSVHAIVKTKPGYNLVSVAAEKLARTKTSPPVGLDTPDPRCVEHLHASASRPWTEDAIWHVVLVESTYEAAMSTFTQFRRFVEEVVSVSNAPQAKLQEPTLAPDDEVYQLAEEPVEPVEAVVAEIKALPRSIEKLVVRPRGGASWDLLRAQVVCHSCVDVVKVLDVLRDHHLKGSLAQVCDVTDRFKFPQAGWADVSVYVHFPGVSQLVCELQVVHNNLLIAREELGAHDQYADTRFARELLTMRRRKDRQQSVSNVRD